MASGGGAPRDASAGGARGSERHGPTLVAGPAVVALLGVSERALAVPLVRLAALPEYPVGHGAADERSWWPAGDPGVDALLAQLLATGGPLRLEDLRASPVPGGEVRLGETRLLACLAAAVRTPAGAPVAMLCALDVSPRWWTDRDAAVLGSISIALGTLLPGPVPASAPPPPARVTEPQPARVTEPPPARVTEPPPARAPAPPAVPPDAAPAPDALAQLAGGIAHNFNNQLTIVSANAELLRDSLRQLDVPDAVRAGALEELAAITRAARTASTLTWQMLAYGRTLPLAPERVDVHARIEALAARLRADADGGAAITLDLALDAPRPTVSLDPAQFEHVLLELADNARRAMPTGGRLSVRTDRVTLEAPYRGTPDCVPLGTWLVISVIDTGTGIAAESLPRVFLPFFTTRDVGSGSGLGLAAVHGIMAQSGGYCTVESAPGRGTAMRLWLPEPAR
jgi:signal transduction histidine kinase